MLKRSTVLLPLVAAALLGVSACSGTEDGTALPTSGVPSQSSGQPTTGASNAPGGAATASIQPCALLSQDELAEFGQFQDGKEQELAGARTCAWFKVRGDDDLMGIGVDIRDEQGVGEARDAGGGVITGQVKGRKAAKIPSAANVGACTMALAVGETSRVDVAVSGLTSLNGGVQRACEIADKVAAIVEPKLPKG